MGVGGYTSVFLLPGALPGPRSPTVNTGGKYPYASDRERGKDHFEMCQSTLFFLTRSALRRRYFTRA